MVSFLVKGESMNTPQLTYIPKCYITSDNILRDKGGGREGGREGRRGREGGGREGEGCGGYEVKRSSGGHS